MTNQTEIFIKYSPTALFLLLPIVITGMGYLMISELPITESDMITDADHNHYESLIIGEQIWLTENLKTTTFNDGTPIKEVAGSSDWMELDSPAFTWFDNDISNKERYGALYNWYAVKSGKLCPIGWQIPSRDDWAQLTVSLSNNNTRLKSCRQIDSPLANDCNTQEHPRWHSHRSIYGTDDFGFAALPGGFRSAHGVFTHFGYFAGWWTSTEDENNALMAWYVGFPYNYSYVYEYNSGKEMGFSVRCLKNSRDP